jgi:hypothetical protein
MKISVFKEIVNQLKNADAKKSAFHKLGLDIYDVTEELDIVLSHLIGSHYGKEGKDIFDWWCYEKDFGENKELKMTDKDGSLLCETIEDLHTYLEENITTDYDLPKQMTDAERERFLKSMFSK